MITVICKVSQCPYISKNGFCRNRVVSITPNGMCGHIYNTNGQVKNNWMQPVQERFKDGYKEKDTADFGQEQQIVQKGASLKQASA